MSAPTTDPAPSTSEKSTFHIGTRKSALALHQTDIATALLKSLHPSFSFQIHGTDSTADLNQVTALHQFNAKSLWTTELEADLLSGATDLVVHSLKDVPMQLPQGCTLGACVLRQEKRDCVVMSEKSRAKGYTGLGDLPDGSVVGTSSVRRLAQLHRLFPGLKTKDVRGNINTRLRKLDDEGQGFDALVLAATGLQRIGFGDRVSAYLSRREGGWFGPVGQGAVGVEIRSEDKIAQGLCEGMMEDGVGTAKKVLLECLAERSMLRTLEGGCSVPLGVETEWNGEDLVVYAMVASLDGQQMVEGNLSRTVKSREDAEACGLAIASALIEKGAGKILGEITLNRKIIEDAGGA